jgi:formamidopyrimidine-DNA glycosylase
MVALCFIHGDQYGITPAQKRCNNQQNNKHEPHGIFNLSLCTPEFTVFFYVMTEISKLFFHSGLENTFYSNLFIMPELPDLQAFSRNLSKKLVGKKVEKINAIYKKRLKTEEKGLQRSLEGATLSSVCREGKELHLSFDNGNVLALHMMLKGQLHLFHEKNDARFTIIELLFTDGTGLAMADFQGQATPTLNPQPKEAPDALSNTVNFKFLKEKLNKSKAAVKKVLIDQQVIRGIGNAYADEILWHARISPFSISNKIPDANLKALAKSIKSVLKQAEKKILKANPEIISGEIRDFVAVHSSKKQKSPTGARILIDKSSARKTYYTREQKLFR